MKFLLAVVIATVLLVQTGSNPFGVKPSVDYGNANFYIDLVLYNVNKALPDQIALPDVGGPFNMDNCYFYGTENGIMRNNDATLITVDNIVKFAAEFRMENVGLACDWKFLLLRGSASGMTSKVTLSSGLSLTIEHGQHPWLTEFRVTTFEPIEVDIKGLTFALNWLAEDIAEWILADIEPKLTEVIETQVGDLFQTVLNQMVLP